VVITDRKKDMILVGGFNVYPREVEDILFTHPKVALAAVVGVPDAKSGEMVKAFIQLKEGELRAREKITSHFESRCIPAGGVVKTRQMKDMPAFSRLAGRAPQLPKLRTYFCANPKMFLCPGCPAPVHRGRLYRTCCCVRSGAYRYL
jgi:acyl-CoA synthetase (AMP-forming)/AMP-acid ligase II